MLSEWCFCVLRLLPRKRLITLRAAVGAHRLHERRPRMDLQDASRFSDADFCRRVARAGWRTAYCPGAGAVHAGGRSSRHATDASLVAFHRSAFRLFWKHASASARLIAPVVFLGLRARLAYMRHRARARERALVVRQGS